MLNADEKIGVIVINYNGLEYTRECLDSLLVQDYRRAEIYLIDNASPDGSGAVLAREYGGACHVILNGNNLGFSAGNNVGIRAALQDGCGAVMLLNNDTVADPSLVSRLAQAVDDKTIAVPYMYYYSSPQELWYAGGYFDWRGKAVHITSSSEVHPTDFATGCCLMYTSAVARRVGEWDERYFLYFEDCDFSVRAERAGIGMRVVPEAKLWHKVSASTGGGASLVSRYYMYRNKLLFAREANMGFACRLWALLSVAAHGLRKKSGIVARLALHDYLDGSFGKMEEAVKVDILDGTTKH